MATKDITDSQVCLAFKQYSTHGAREGKYPYHYLMEWTKECEKVCVRAMERAENRGYVDCGVSLRTGWLTEKGKELIGDAG